MTRRKSDFKRTLVLVLIVCPSVFSRPQETLTTSISAETTESPLRYFRVDDSKSLHHVEFESNNRNLNNYNTSIFHLQYLPSYFNNQSLRSTHNNRTNRLLHKSFKVKQNSNRNINAGSKPTLQGDRKVSINKETRKNKPVIKKIVTKWADKVKEDNLDFSQEGESNKPDSLALSYYSSTEVNYDFSGQISDKRYTHNHYPQSEYSEETNVYSNNFHIIDKHPYSSPTRPSFIYSKPTPTPIITNVGYPQPWPNNIHNTKKPSTIKPSRYTKPPYNYYPSYQGNPFEVTTFPPTTGYTDRIVIRPEEYAATSDDCPTIFLTLNNTFQGQGKEACPDLNIAVNTNVVNKNVVVESEEDSDTTLTDIFGLPDDNSESDENLNSYSEENEEDESAPIESLELSNYNAGNDAIEAESAESGNFAQPSSPISTLSRPTKNDKDDGFGLSSIVDFFHPAISAFSWLATINPLSFPALSFILTPIILLVAGTSGIAALFAPWVLSYARQAPDFNFLNPQRRGDVNYETFNLNSPYNDNTWRPRHIVARSTKLDIKKYVYVKRQTWYEKLKQWMTTVTEILNSRRRRVKRKK